MATKTTRSSKKKRQVRRPPGKRRAAASAPQAPAKWRVFAYLAGDNNLSDEMIWSLLGMQQSAVPAAFRKRVSLTAVYDPVGWAPLIYTFQGDKMARQGLEQLRSPHSPLQGIPQLTSLDQLRFFIDQQLGDTSHFGPAEPQRTMIILSGHGDGVSGLLTDQDPGSSLTVRDLGTLLEYAVTRARNQLLAHNPDLRGSDAGAGRIEILGLESCAMSMLEVCYEVRESVDFLIGTESFISNNGWPYAQIFAPLLGSRQSPESVAMAMGEIYARYYTEYDIAGSSGDLAVVSLAGLRWVESAGQIRFPPLIESLRKLASELTQLLAQAGDEARELDDERGTRWQPASGQAAAAATLRDALIVARWNAQSFHRDDYVDLWDFCSQLDRALGVAGPGARGLRTIQELCREVLAALDSVVLLSRYQGPEYQHSHGLSVYFPAARARYVRDYRNLKFAEDARWARFLELYLQRTQRRVRLDEKPAEDWKRYSYELEAGVASVTVPGSKSRNPAEGTKRNPAEGTKRNPAEGTKRNPAEGTKRGANLSGYAKNGATEWHRDPPTRLEK